ncbi:hypothetical protein Pla52n_44050 [Stieleria varia]|uniref:Uncharacterized protein n=2 Tax=Stieleria varia TaxID=2528005 RepID=A0A5C6AS85_9BACT|nr:hypothetical protein Pla52n_44050 [Stieleria varia]
MPCRVFELYSEFDCELEEFTSVAHIERHYAITDWSLLPTGSLHFQIYAEEAKGNINIQHIELNPKKCNGATTRYCCEGWGLIQLYLQSPRNGRLANSHSNHNSETRANKWAETYNRMGNPADWDWTAVNSFSRRLNRQIRKLAVAKQQSRVILPCAAGYMGVGTESEET